MNELFNLNLLFSTIRLATPLILAALGGMFSERSGVINIALEGLMLAGAFTAASITYYAGSPWVGLFAAILAGACIALIHAVACIRFKADQVASGTAINILLTGVPALLSGAFFLSSGSTPQIPKENLMPPSLTVTAISLFTFVWSFMRLTPLAKYSKVVQVVVTLVLVPVIVIVISNTPLRPLLGQPAIIWLAFALVPVSYY